MEPIACLPCFAYCRAHRLSPTGLHKQRPWLNWVRKAAEQGLARILHQSHLSSAILLDSGAICGLAIVRFDLLLLELNAGLGPGINALDHVNNRGALLLWRVIDATAVIARDPVVHHRGSAATIRQGGHRHTDRYPSARTASRSAAHPGDTGRRCRPTDPGHRQGAD